MRQQVAIALMLAGMAMPVFAQRGGGHGGFSGGGTRGGFSGGGIRAGGAPISSGRSFGAPMSSRTMPPGFRGYGFAPQRAVPSRTGGMRNPAGMQVARAGYASGRAGSTGVIASVRRDRRGYPGRYRNGYPYPWGVSAWIAPNYLGYPDAGYYDDGLYYEGGDEPFDSASLASGSPDDTYVEALQPSDDEYAQGVDTYGRPQPSPKTEAGVTLIFKDGRPPETIHNYMLTQTELMVVKGQRQYEIPVAELDVAATEQANKAAGVVFQLPRATP